MNKERVQHHTRYTVVDCDTPVAFSKTGFREVVDEPYTDPRMAAAKAEELNNTEGRERYFSRGIFVKVLAGGA